ncbi:MAG: UPF0104 family protein [Candidatus Zixiibacteriota bacterium]|nr:MAG: UPF0104 family protein [candidate division Zixibacteria bacterium]
MKRRIAIGVFLSVLFIYLSFWTPDFSSLFSGKAGMFQALFGRSKIDLAELGRAMAQANYIYLLFGVGLLLASLIPRAERWRILIKPVSPGIRYWPVFNAMSAGYMVNNVLPLRMGELFRAYFVGTSEKISKSSVLATIVVERLLDVMSGVVLLAVTIFFFPFPEEYRRGLFILGAGMILGFAFLVSLLVNTRWTLKLLTALLFPLPERFRHPILHAVEGFSGGLEILRSAHHYTAVFGYTALLQVIYVISAFFTLSAFDLVSPSYPIIYDNPLLASVVLLIFNTIGVAIPSAPGAVGTFHYVIASGVQLFGVTAEAAMGVAITLHLAQYIPLTLIGLICFWSQNFRIADLKKQIPQEAAGEVSTGSDESQSVSHG